jgi:nitrogen permease regulator 2-like protein
MDVNWDLTMQKVVPFIDGINSVKRISELADADYNLTRKCIEHLLYYGTLICVDIFQFNAMYACTPEISTLVADPRMQEECAAYIAAGGPTGPKTQAHLIIELYCSLEQGLSVKQWATKKGGLLQGVDIRRFISFGIIKGFLYRIHKYAIRAPSLDADGKDDKAELPLTKYLDGTRRFDEICTDLQISEKELIARIKTYGPDVIVFHK